MKRILIFLLILAAAITGCAVRENTDTVIIGGADGPTSIYVSSDTKLGSIPGTWQTASMGYEDDGTMYPEYYVQFTDSDIVYGHMKDDVFTPDHSDRISSSEETGPGVFRIQAEAANGVRYTYQTSESDVDVLEYYETWDGEYFPEMYRGGASLVRID